MIIDNIKKYILSILGKVHKSQNDNVTLVSNKNGLVKKLIK